MTEKLNSKYTGILNEDQRDIVREYVFSLETEDDSKIRTKLVEVRKESLSRLNRFKEITENKTLLEKIDDVKLKIQNECSSELCDESISRFLVLMNLSSELGDTLGR